jgi:hypothetical protein
MIKECCRCEKEAEVYSETFNGQPLCYPCVKEMSGEKEEAPPFD